MSDDPSGLREFFVTTPTYSYVERVLDDGTGPTYDIADFEQVQAHTKREAVSIAVKKWLAERNDNYVNGRRSDALCPFTGIRAEVATCEHGVEMPLGFSDDFWCDDCQRRYDDEIASEAATPVPHEGDD